MIKEELYRWLRLDRPTEESGEPYPPGYCHFPKYSEEYFKQITAEQLFGSSRLPRRTQLRAGCRPSAIPGTIVMGRPGGEPLVTRHLRAR